jgi:hypothetical protein
MALAAALLLTGAGGAEAQLLGGGLGGGGLSGGGLGPLPGPGGLLRPLPDRLDPGGAALGGALDTLRRSGEGLGAAASNVLRDTVGRPRDFAIFDLDEQGRRVVYDEILVLAPTAEALDDARALGFEALRSDDLQGLGLSLVKFRIPRSASVAQAMATLRRAIPGAVLDYNHVYDPSGGAVDAASPGIDICRRPAPDVAIGIVDAGIDRRHPALRDAAIVAANLAGTGAGPPTAHGTEVASLLVGESVEMTGALVGATLYAADVFGGAPAGGAADAVVRGLAWLAARKVPVINVSLTGPPNRMVEAAVRALARRGHVVAAAAGNDGPAVPVAYPAAYEGAVAVTAVDAGHAVLLDANRGPELAFAALGVSVMLAGPAQDYRRVTGTSFAAPLVAARFALAYRRLDPAAAAHALEALRTAALDLGAPGRDPVFGHGFIACAAEVRPQFAGSR